MRHKRTLALLSAAAFVGTILAANYVTSRYGRWPVAPGLTATAGTYFAGAAFVLRDAVQDFGSQTAAVPSAQRRAGKRWVLAAIAAGALLSFLVGAPGIAVASAAAFAVSELVDFGVYTPLRRRGYIRAAAASNLAGTIVDTVVFLSLAASTLRAFDPGFTVAGAFAGQVIGKLAVTAAVVLLVAAVRRTRQPAEAAA